MNHACASQLGVLGSAPKTGISAAGTCVLGLKSVRNLGILIVVDVRHCRWELARLFHLALLTKLKNKPHLVAAVGHAYICISF